MCYVHLIHKNLTYLCFRVWGSTPELNKLIFLKKKIWMFILSGININKYLHVNSGQVLPLWELILNLPLTRPHSVFFVCLWIGQFSDSVSLEEACAPDTGWLEYPTYHGPQSGHTAKTETNHISLPGIDMEAERQRYCPTFQIKYSMDILSLISSDAISFPPKDRTWKEGNYWKQSWVTKIW